MQGSANHADGPCHAERMTSATRARPALKLRRDCALIRDVHGFGQGPRKFTDAYANRARGPCHAKPMTSRIRAHASLKLRRTCFAFAWLRRSMVRADGIEPTRPAWKAGVLPLNYARLAQDGRDSPLRPFGQARSFLLSLVQSGRQTGFSPGFYPLSDCRLWDCAVVWSVWHSSLPRQLLRFTLLDRRPRKRPPT